MNQNLKRGVMRVLCWLLVIPTLAGVLPQTKLEAQAASKVSLVCSDLGYGGGPPDEIHMTTKTKGFYIGDYIRVVSSSVKYGRLSFNSGVTYKSSNPKVASINSSGLITPKKKGSTKITVKYKGASWKVDLAVVSEVKGEPSAYKELQTAAKTLSKECGKKITSSNRYKVFNADIAYRKARMKVNINTSAMYTNGICPTYDGKLIANVVAPVLGRGSAISHVISDYICEKNPIGSTPAKSFKSVGISGKNSSVTVKLSKKVTEDQIFGIKAVVNQSKMNKIKKSNKAEFPVKIKDIKTGKKYSATATATKGKDTLTIKLAKNKKLKKNRSYRLMGVDKGSISSAWAKQGKTKFTAK